MGNKELGLIYPDGSFSSRDEIRRKLLAKELTGSSRLVKHADLPQRWDFEKWTQRIVERQAERNELLGIPESAEVTIEASKPILVALIGDVHAGGIDVDYERFGRDIDLIKSVGGYAVTVGDLTDGYFFMPGVNSQIMPGQEQVLYMQAALDKLAEDDKLLAGWPGDHDMWATDKMGASSLYAGFNEKYGAPLFDGVSYLTINLDNGGGPVPYRFVGSHRHKGFSVYNDAHASLRQYRDEGVMSDVSFTAHNHVKACLEQTHKLHGGKEVVVRNVALGAYKKSDRYSRKMGWPRKDDAGIGAFGLILTPGEKSIDVCWTISEAVNRLTTGH